MITITTTEALAAFCERARQAPYLTVDTEFLRERTYYAKLCLVQLAIPGDADENAVIVDPLADGLDLAPLYAVLGNAGIVKVFHAARQDLEIFFIQGRVIPHPLFDTQVAAMVCGFGEQVGYETLVRKIARSDLDKTSRFTDWSRRPLSEAQKAYALADVTHLRQIYEHLEAELERSGRREWVEEELAILSDPATYVVEPEEAWRRVRTRTHSGRFMALVKELARFREIHAQTNDIPRTRVYKDDALLELASVKPRSPQDLSRTRLLLREARRGPIADGIIAAVEAALAYAPEDCPAVDKGREKGQASPALADLLRVLLKAKSEDVGVAQKLIASAADLDAIAAGDRDVQALTGWRRKVFGGDALRLCEGQIALAAAGDRVRVIEL
jgi:ribonuclease D